VNNPEQRFIIIWLGQFFSVIGSTMTQFALAIWIWEQTGTVTPMILTTVFFFAPTILVGPVAGALVDRLNRKKLMLASDTLAGFASLTVFLLFSSGHLQVWHLYIVAFLSGTFQSVQVPALMASISTLVPKESYSRAASLMGLSDNVGQILAPALAGLLYAVIHVNGILLIDFLTFVIALLTMVKVAIPQPETSEDGQSGRGSLLNESLFGFRYLFNHSRLLGLFLFMIIVNILVEPWASMLSPLVLARTGGDTVTLAWVQAGGFVGAILGGAAVFRMRVKSGFLEYMLISLGLMGLFTVPIGIKGTLFAWIAAHFMFFFLQSFASAYHQTIWQLAVPHDVQGRVFAVRRLTFGLSATLSPYLFGQLADHVFEPAFYDPHPHLGWFVGHDSGAGIAAIFVLCSLLLLSLAMLAMLAVPLFNRGLLMRQKRSASTT
jgi:MFS transporter, DHA3 family, macrolide efflux protein